MSLSPHLLYRNALLLALLLSIMTAERAAARARRLAVDTPAIRTRIAALVSSLSEEG